MKRINWQVMGTKRNSFTLTKVQDLCTYWNVKLRLVHPQMMEILVPWRARAIPIRWRWPPGEFVRVTCRRSARSPTSCIIFLLFPTFFFTVEQMVAFDQTFRDNIINCCTFIQNLLLGLGRSFEFFWITWFFSQLWEFSSVDLCDRHK